MTGHLNRAAHNVVGTPGSGDLLLGSVPDGFVSALTAGAVDGATYEFMVETADGLVWEAFKGTYRTSGPTIERTNVRMTSNGGAGPLNLPADCIVYSSVSAQSLIPIIGGNMDTSMYDPAGIDEQLVGLTAAQTLTNKTLTDPLLSGAPTADLGVANKKYVDDAVGGVYPAVFHGVSTSNTAAENTSALDTLTAAVSAAGGGTIVFPAGIFPLNALSTITGSVKLRGQGSYSGGTELDFRNTTGDSITLDDCAHGGLFDLFINHGSVRKTSGFSVKITGTLSFRPRLVNLRFDYGFNGIYVEQCAGMVMDYITMRYMFGSEGVFLRGGSSSVEVHSVQIDHILCDNPYPNAYGAVVTWSNSLAVNLNEITIVNGAVYQCTTAGTTAAAGSGPSGLPSGTTGPTAFSNTITDNTVEWKYICHDSLTWFLMDSHAYSASIENAQFINGVRGVQMRDLVGSGASSRPKWLNLTNVEVDHPYGAAVQSDGGEGVYMESCWLGSSLTDTGARVQSGFAGEINISKTRIVGNYSHGILFNKGGSIMATVSDCIIALNSQSGSANADGIHTITGAEDVSISNNICGQSAEGSGQQGYGINIGSTNDNIIVRGNNNQGNVTGGLNQGTVASATVVYADNI